MKSIKDLFGKEDPTLEEIDAWICDLAEKVAATPGYGSSTREDRIAICRWVLRSLIYGDMKIDVLKSINVIPGQKK